MTPDDITSKLASLYEYSFNTPEKAVERTKLYRDGLGGIEPDRLSTAYRRTMQAWKGKNPPMPADILDNLPPLESAPKADRDDRLSEREVERIMRGLVATQPGRAIVADGLAMGLEDMVRRRLIASDGQMSMDLADKLRGEAERFKASLGEITNTGEVGAKLMSMGRTLQEKAQRINAKWAAYLSKQPAA